MIVLWRGTIWILGSLSVAVIARATFELTISPPVDQALALYSDAVRIALEPVRPAIAGLLPTVGRTLDTGVDLQAHWPHIFLLTLMHLAPRADASRAGADGVLWWLQAAGASVLAVVIAAMLAGAPLLGDNMQASVALAVLIACELLVNLFHDVEGTIAERVSEFETGDTNRQVTWRSILQYVLYPLAGLTVLLAAAIYYFVSQAGWAGVLMYWQLILGFYVAGAVLILSWAVVLQPREKPRTLRRSVFSAPITNLGRVGLGLALLCIAVALVPAGRSVRRGTRRVALLAMALAFPLAAVFILGRLGINSLLGREEMGPPAPSALGLFIVGGAVLLGGAAVFGFLVES